MDADFDCGKLSKIRSEYNEFNVQCPFGLWWIIIDGE